MGLIEWLFGTARFVPHGFCMLWRPDLVAIHVTSDFLIAAAYFAIPGAIWWFVQQRTDLSAEHRRIALLFAAFITACGLTHVAGIATLWAPYYGLQAIIKVWTAVVSVATACLLPFVAPRLLKIPAPSALQAANERLQAEVSAHQATLAQLEFARAGLERQVADRDEDLRIANARFEAALRDSPINLSEQDQDLRYTWIFNAPEEQALGRTARELVDEGAEELDAFKRKVIETGEAVRGEVRIVTGGKEAWYGLRVMPTRLRDGRAGLMTVSFDITSLKQQQAHLELITRELNHRSKNLLTIVQSIARQTAAGLEVPKAFMERLSERLHALAAAHDVLVAGAWRGADLKAVVESQLRHQIQSAPDRIRVAGEPLQLPPEMAHYVGLAVHELGANATKYGALSADRGEVEVTWRAQDEEAGGHRLVFEWREAGGPKVEAKPRRGFGRTILEVLTPRALAGQAELTFAPEGVTWRLEAPLNAP